MSSNFKKLILKRALALLLITSFVLPASLAPIFAPTPKAEAILGVGDINLESIPTIVEFIFKAIASNIANRLLDDMIKKTIDWANGGFEGNPGYTTDLGDRLLNIADQAAGEFIGGSDLAALCSPFKTNLTLSLQRYYKISYQSDYGARGQYQCTLSGIVDNIDGFFDSFDRGGWDAWITMTQNPNNNPYGAYLKASTDLDRRISNKVNLEKTQLGWNKGYMSWAECLVENPPAKITVEDTLPAIGNNPPVTIRTERDNPDYNPNVKPGACAKRGPTQTPGSVISSKLEQALGAGMSNIISADSIDALFNAFLNGILERYVFSERGLFDTQTATGRQNYDKELVDLDNDYIPDGWDYTANGQLDICLHGLIDRSAQPSNNNCYLSGSIESSPYFVPICEDLSRTIRDTEKFLKFVQLMMFRDMSFEVSSKLLDTQAEREGYAYDSSYYETLSKYNKSSWQIWLNEMTAASSAMDKLVGTFSRYGAHVAFLSTIEAIGWWQTWIKKRTESLVKDNDLNDTGNSNEEMMGRVYYHTYNTLKHLKDLEPKIKERCEAPDLDAIANIVKLVPPVFGEAEGTNPENDPGYDPGTGFNEGDQ